MEIVGKEVVEVLESNVINSTLNKALGKRSRSINGQPFVELNKMRCGVLEQFFFTRFYYFLVKPNHLPLFRYKRNNLRTLATFLE